MFKKKSLLLVLLFLSFVSFAQKVAEQNNSFLYSGRVENLADYKVILIGSASSVSFNFKGNLCSISLQTLEEHQNYVTLELDGTYIGRVRIEKGALQSFPIVISKKKRTHRLTIYKATEAANGGVLFNGTIAKLTQITLENKKK
ncbi:hypothetical protein ACFX5F_03530 [Flavobacterium sp. ZS1P70]|uniref:Carbohydrate esterase 2 N-terminal domain-containing protein n=1 Tax=Flavobacterium zhoui TaxID=3230414 RepID=A0ABW6I1Y6_9FLAO